MAARKGGLGKGFEALMQSNTMDDELGEKATLSINDIEPNRGQPRKTFSEESLSELADSIREHGVLQPLLVRPMPDGSYRLVAGERRFRAARLAGLYEVPVTVREMTDEEESVFALIENLQREDLNAVEEAEGYKNPYRHLRLHSGTGGSKARKIAHGGYKFTQAFESSRQRRFSFEGR